MSQDYDRQTHALERFVPIDQYKELYEKVCFSPEKYVAFDAIGHFEAYARSMCKLVKTPKSYFPSYWAGAIRRGSKYKRSFDIG